MLESTIERIELVKSQYIFVRINKVTVRSNQIKSVQVRSGQVRSLKSNPALLCYNRITVGLKTDPKNFENVSTEGTSTCSYEQTVVIIFGFSRHHTIEPLAS